VKPDPHKPLAHQNVQAGHVAAPDSDKTNNTLRAYNEVRRRIFDGEMAPGTQYLEQELAEMLGMSRTPVREALIRLADERLVEVRPRHGARVLGVSADDIADVYEITAELEATAARRLAARGLSASEIAALTDACARMDAATAKKDFAAWIRIDEEFHTLIVKAAGNQRLTELFEELMAQVHRARRQTMTERAVPMHSNKEHAALLDALKAGNAEQSHRLSHEHRLRARGDLTALLRHMPAKG
jgi:DNA-binding GntR family transcriptional regulator